MCSGCCLSSRLPHFENGVVWPLIFTPFFHALHSSDRIAHSCAPFLNYPCTLTALSLCCVAMLPCFCALASQVFRRKTSPQRREVPLQVSFATVSSLILILRLVYSLSLRLAYLFHV